MPVVYDSDIVITHMPKGSHTARDLQAFERQISKGERLSSRLLEMYARELFVSGQDDDFVRAEDFFKEVVADCDRKPDEIMAASCVCATAARIRDDVHSFLKYAMKAVAMEGCSEICLELGRFYMALKDYEEAAIWLYNAVYETAPVLNIHSGGDTALELLAECYRTCGNTEQAGIYEQAIIQWKDENKASH